VKEMKNAECGVKRNNAGLVEEEMRLLSRDMTTMALGTLATRGVLVSEKERTALQRVITGHLQNSVEIEAALAMIVEREHNPKEAA
jgi:hypothetical protein